LSVASHRAPARASPVPRLTPERRPDPPAGGQDWGSPGMASSSHGTVGWSARAAPGCEICSRTHAPHSASPHTRRSGEDTTRPESEHKHRLVTRRPGMRGRLRRTRCRACRDQCARNTKQVAQGSGEAGSASAATDRLENRPEVKHHAGEGSAAAAPRRLGALIPYALAIRLFSLLASKPCRPRGLPTPGVGSGEASRRLSEPVRHRYPQQGPSILP
jgi:hypothetical protein